MANTCNTLICTLDEARAVVNERRRFRCALRRIAKGVVDIHGARFPHPASVAQAIAAHALHAKPRKRRR